MRHRYRTDTGFITYKVEGSTVHLETIWVNRLIRGQGKGTIMLQAFLDTLKDCVVVGECWDERPLNFYKRLGFKITKSGKIWKIEKVLSSDGLTILPSKRRMAVSYTY
jgi:GNAT superfamily N-acetyltransferase